MAALIEQPPPDTSPLAPKLGLIVEAIKNGISPALKAQLLEGIRDSAESHRPTGQSMDALRDMWRDLLPQFRILCLTESPAHTAMWYHYADKYRGVVLELRCDDELDSAWLAAKPVAYQLAKPQVYTADGWAELLTLRIELAVRKILDVATYTKSPDWNYEREWRITSFKRPGDTGPFTDYKLQPQEISGLYFGPKISATDREAVSALVATYPSIKLWNVSIGMNREFEFSAASG